MSSTKPVERTGGERYQAESNLLSLVKVWALKDADKLKRSCASCTYAVRSGPFKCAAYNTVPPIDVIMNGCDGYSDSDDIPF